DGMHLEKLGHGGHCTSRASKDLAPPPRLLGTARHERNGRLALRCTRQPDRRSLLMQLLIDFFPIVVFFVVYKLAGIYWATGAIIVAMGLQMGVQWLRERKVS